MCSLELPDLETSFHQAYRDEGLLVLGLSAGGNATPEQLDAFLAATGVQFPVLRDTDNTYQQYAFERALTPYPIDVVVDADGVIVYLSQTYDPAALHAAVARVLE